MSVLMCCACRVKPTVVVLQHVAMEGPARIAHAAARAGLRIEVVRLHEGQQVPRVNHTDILVVMGGPMGVADVGSEAFAFLAAEVALLRQRLQAHAPCLGICLGAQLLAHAAGARVYPNTRLDALGGSVPVIELGWGPVTFNNSGQEACFQGLGTSSLMLHWHGDTFDVPAGAVHLASTPVCKHQMFRIGTRIFGLQFHCEADAETVGKWVNADADYVQRALGPQGQDIVRAQTRALPATQMQMGDQLLDNLFGCMLS